MTDLRNFKRPFALVLMGVAGSGKTTIGKELARRLSCGFFDADDYHSAANVAKMRSGKPLDDDDRVPWLDSLRSLIETEMFAGRSMVLACSALRESYRRRLLPLEPRLTSRVTFVYLRVTEETAKRRLLSRSGHYMPPALVPSQFQLLEEPRSALRVNAEAPAEEVLNQIEISLTDRQQACGDHIRDPLDG